MNIFKYISNFFKILYNNSYKLYIKFMNENPNRNPYNTKYSSDFFDRVNQNRLSEPSIDNTHKVQQNENNKGIEVFDVADIVDSNIVNDTNTNIIKPVYELEFNIMYEGNQRKPIGRILENKDSNGRVLSYHTFTKYENNSKSKSGVYVLLSKDIELKSDITYTMKGHLFRPDNSKFILFEPINKQYFKQ